MTEIPRALQQLLFPRFLTSGPDFIAALPAPLFKMS